MARSKRRRQPWGPRARARACTRATYARVKVVREVEAADADLDLELAVHGPHLVGELVRVLVGDGGHELRNDVADGLHLLEVRLALEQALLGGRDRAELRMTQRRRLDHLAHRLLCGARLESTRLESERTLFATVTIIAP